MKDTSVSASPAVPADCNAYEGANGMTLRQYIAIKAMQSEIIAQNDRVGYYIDDESLAKKAYKIADAMILEGNK